MEKVILIIGGIAYTIFFIQFLCSLLGFDSDIDIDIDLDGDVDFSLSDLVSFKGFLHFVMGVVTYLYPKVHSGTPLTVYSWIIAAAIGMLFVVGLYFIYKWCMRLQHIPKREEGYLESREVVILRATDEPNVYIGAATINGAYDHFEVISDTPLVIGRAYKITKFNNNKIYI